MYQAGSFDDTLSDAKANDSRGQSAIQSMIFQSEKHMKCADIQFDLAFYADGSLGCDETHAVASHLNVCPLCRQADSEYRELMNGLRSMRRPKLSFALKRRINDTVRTEILSQRQVSNPIHSDLREWLTMQFMPYSIGVVASLFIGVTFLTIMFSARLQPSRGDLARSGETAIMLASNIDPHAQMTGLDMISPSEFARSRMDFAAESPSVNPQGALIALTKSLVRGGMKDDEVVVVADVFSNGLARVAEVVEPSHNSQAILDLERALQSDPAFAPFVPSKFETRPDSVRVVLKFQSVNVSTRQRRNRRL